MTIAAGTIALNINYEGFWLMILLITMQNVASSEKKAYTIQEGKSAKNIPYLWPKWPQSIHYLSP